VTGLVALHGGGEFQPGDEAFLGAVLETAPRTSGKTVVAVVPTAAARGRPDLAGANGVAAFERVARDLGRDVTAGVVPVIDAASAGEPSSVAALRAADVIHFPGGDPDLIPTILPDTPAWEAIRDALAGGAVLAGASAGAMALGSWTWTPDGGVPGLGVVDRLVVVPHATERSFGDAVARYRVWAPPDVGALGLAERTGVIGPPEGPWRVVGEGSAYWLASSGASPLERASGDQLRR
jgi:cyanophycinase